MFNFKKIGALLITFVFVLFLSFGIKSYAFDLDSYGNLISTNVLSSSDIITTSGFNGTKVVDINIKFDSNYIYYFSCDFESSNNDTYLFLIMSVPDNDTLEYEFTLNSCLFSQVLLNKKNWVVDYDISYNIVCTFYDGDFSNFKCQILKYEYNSNYSYYDINRDIIFEGYNDYCYYSKEEYDKLDYKSYEWYLKYTELNNSINPYLTCSQKTIGSKSNRLELSDVINSYNKNIDVIYDSNVQCNPSEFKFNAMYLDQYYNLKFNLYNDDVYKYCYSIVEQNGNWGLSDLNFYLYEQNLFCSLWLLNSNFEILSYFSTDLLAITPGSYNFDSDTKYIVVEYTVQSNNTILILSTISNYYYKQGYDTGKSDYDSLKSLYIELLNDYHDVKVLLEQYQNKELSFNNLIWNIATIPFESFKTIWGVDLFGISISSICIGIMFAGIVLFVLKKIK